MFGIFYEEIGHNMGSLTGGNIRLVPYDRVYLELSWEWLRDPEIKTLTQTRDFTRAQQLAFFAALPERKDYKIWGLKTLEGHAIGAAGIKHIKGNTGESWCYIGERDWWGRGIGGQILTLCEEKARYLGLKQLTMFAATDNRRSISLYSKMGFMVDAERSTQKRVAMYKPIDVRSSGVRND